MCVTHAEETATVTTISDAQLLPNQTLAVCRVKQFHHTGGCPEVRSCPMDQVWLRKIVDLSSSFVPAR